jgi:octaprenyl-diphosphate synthase
VKEKGGIEYTREKMMEYKQNALDILVDFPSSEAREALINLVDYSITRTK